MLQSTLGEGLKNTRRSAGNLKRHGQHHNIESRKKQFETYMKFQRITDYLAKMCLFLPASLQNMVVCIAYVHNFVSLPHFCWTLR